MSRSYKKFPVVRQERVDKHFWNRRFRRQKLNYATRGSQYKRFWSNWDDWNYRWTLQEAIESYIPSKHYPTLESWIEYWKKCCLRK